MIKQFFAAAIIVTALASIQTEASFVHTDWKNAGDAQATLDSSTGLEWLKLNNTSQKSYLSVKNEIDTIYQGWRLPTQDEVMQLFRNLLGNNYAYLNNQQPYQTRFSTSLNQRNKIKEFLGQTGPNSYGWYQLDNSSIGGGGGLWNDNFWYLWTYPNESFGGSRTGSQETGVFLVSDGGTTLSSINDPKLNINNPNAPINQGGSSADVASPAGLAAAGALLMFLGARRRKLRGE